MNAPESPSLRGPDRCRFIPAFLSVAILLVCAGGCSKSPEELKAEKAAEVARTTGRLAVKSNRANTTVEVSRVPAAGEAAPELHKGNEEGAAEHNFSSLAPGSYKIVAKSRGWPELSQTAQVTAGGTAAVALDFKSGSLRLESVPVGATVKFGGASLGKTPLTIPQLPPGEIDLLIEYPLWPALTFKATVAEGVETAATARMPHGRLIVESTPSGASVLFGKRAIGQTPLTIERYQAGNTKLTLQAKNFPPLEIPVAMEDRGELKFNEVLAMAFPEMDPTALLTAIWVTTATEDKERLAPGMKPFTSYPSRNGVVKNLDRKKLAESWLDKRYRFIALIKSYDKDDGVIEFAEEKNDLTRYRVLAKLSAEARANREVVARLVKEQTFSLYGYLSAVEEPVWPAKVITFEFTEAEALPAP